MGEQSVGDFQPNQQEEEVKYEDVTFSTGKRDVSLDKLPTDLDETERTELQKSVLVFVNNFEEVPEWLDLEKMQNWEVAAGSWGGLLFNGQDVWDHQKEGETPGVLVRINRYSDGGARFADILAGNF